MSARNAFLAEALPGARTPGKRLARAVFQLAATLALSSLVPPAVGVARAATAPQAGETVGQPWIGEAGVRETVAEIMGREARIVALGIPPKIKHKPPPGHRALRELPQNPESPAVPQFPRMAAPAVSQTPPVTPQSLGVSFTGATLSGINPVLTFPPDTMGAVGPAQYIIMVNNRIVSFSKGTGVADGVINITTDTFFNSVRNATSTTDPRIRYDRLSGRWFLIITNLSTGNRILIAVSDSGSQGVITSTTAFTFFFIPTNMTPPPISSTCFADYPTLGIDANALYIGTNNFCGANQTFNSTDGYVVQKASVLGAGPLVVTVFRGLVPTPTAAGPFTPQGVDNYDPAATEGYFIGEDNATFGTLMLRRVSDPGGTPSISGNIPITVLTTAFPLLVPHLGNTGGTAGQLDALDDRLFAAHIRNGRLWTAHNIGVDSTGTASGAPDRDGVRWYELQGIASPATPSIVQSGTIFDNVATNPRFFWIPTVLVSGQGHAAFGFSTAGNLEHANAGTVGRLSGDPLGTIQTPLLYTNSTTAYNPPADPGGPSGRRWGDYSYTSLDPNDDMTMWTIQEFCDATNSFGVQIVKLIAPPPATPASASSSVPPGQTSITVTITGTSVSGSSFYDPGPGAGFTHITATVSGGVTVNTASFVNPTTVTLSLNTTAATAGTKDVTITNPDGQSATGIGILTVAAGAAASSTILASSTNPSVFGQLVTFTATVSGGAGTPTGTVTLRDGTTALATAFLDAIGQATLSTPNLAVGSHSMAANYSGSSVYAPSTSTAIIQVANKASTTSVVTSSLNPSTQGNLVTFTARVSAAAPGSGTPTGSVQFFDGTTLLSTVALAGGSASFTTGTLKGGGYNLSANYGGDGNFNASVSAILLQVVRGKGRQQVTSQ